MTDRKRKYPLKPREIRWVIEILNPHYPDDELIKILKQRYERETGQNVECLLRA